MSENKTFGNAIPCKEPPISGTNGVLFTPSEAVCPEEAAPFLAPFGAGRPLSTHTLLSYDWESGHFRRIVRCRCGEDDLVLKIRREEGLHLHVVNSQCRFSQYLSDNGIHTARFLPVVGDGADGEHYAAAVAADREPVIVTVERFCGGQLEVVTPDIAEAIGGLLARAHNISERGGCHAGGRVLFDPFKQNDLFSLEEFEALIPLCGKEKHFAEEIAGRGRELLSHLVPFAELPRFAVQGDMADCNLFVTPEGELGLFDFNNCGDNAPFLDAVMHAVYISRLMEYGKPAEEKVSETMFVRFWRGYTSVRPLAANEEGAVNEFTRLICAFWKFDVTFREDSLRALLRAGEHEKTALSLARMAQKLNGDNLFA